MRIDEGMYSGDEGNDEGIEKSNEKGIQKGIDEGIVPDETELPPNRTACVSACPKVLVVFGRYLKYVSYVF